jgi:hypothetical protein
VHVKRAHTGRTAWAPILAFYERFVGIDRAIALTREEPVWDFLWQRRTEKKYLELRSK